MPVSGVVLAGSDHPVAEVLHVGQEARFDTQGGQLLEQGGLVAVGGQAGGQGRAVADRHLPLSGGVGDGAVCGAASGTAGCCG